MLFHKNNRIVIAGCGPLGAALAKSLYHKGHRVVVLDKDRESFRYLPEEFRGYEMEGDPTDPQVLKAAGIEDAGLFIASTQDDNTNPCWPRLPAVFSMWARYMPVWMTQEGISWSRTCLSNPSVSMICRQMTTDAWQRL